MPACEHASSAAHGSVRCSLSGKCCLGAILLPLPSIMGDHHTRKRPRCKCVWLSSQHEVEHSEVELSEVGTFCVTNFAVVSFLVLLWPGLTDPHIK